MCIICDTNLSGFKRLTVLCLNNTIVDNIIASEKQERYNIICIRISANLMAALILDLI